MAFTCGFYDSLNGDRKYNSIEMSQLFDGLIHDGVYETIGQCFKVSASSGTEVTVGTGRAWFDHTWNLNDSLMIIDCGESEILLDRIDAVVLEVDRTQEVRNNSIKVVKGTPSSNPAKPTLSKSNDIYQYPLGYIRRYANNNTIATADITNAVGTSECPFVIGVVKSMDIDFFIEQWGAQWNDWISKKKQNIIMDWDTWFHEMQDVTETDLTKWIRDKQDIFIKWFNSLNIMLEPDVATNLASQIAELILTFDGLAKDQTLYRKIKDDNGEDILDDSDNPIYGSVKFALAGSNSLEMDAATLTKFLNIVKADYVSKEDFNKITDYVISNETSGAWTIRKWNSGVMEMWWSKSYSNRSLTKHSSTNIPNTPYNVLEATSYPEYPYQFAAAPQVIHFDVLASDICWHAPYWIDDNWDTSNRIKYLPVGMLVSHDPVTINTAVVSAYVKGRWK